MATVRNHSEPGAGAVGIRTKSGVCMATVPDRDPVRKIPLALLVGPVALAP